MSNIPSHIEVELKPLRKNSKVARYRVLELNNDGMVGKVTTYETMREAIYHAMTKKNGDIISIYRGELKAFYCKYHSKMKFGFQATEWDKSCMVQDFWWADF
jgi:hypothetical protein